MGGKIRKDSGNKTLDADFFSIITENEKFKNEISALIAKNEQSSKLVVKLSTTVKLLEKERTVQLKVINQLKKLLETLSKQRSFVCYKHKSCKIFHPKYNWNSNSSTVKSLAKPNLAGDVFFKNISYEDLVIVCPTQNSSYHGADTKKTMETKFMNMKFAMMWLMSMKSTKLIKMKMIPI